MNEFMAQEYQKVRLESAEHIRLVRLAMQANRSRPRSFTLLRLDGMRKVFSRWLQRPLQTSTEAQPVLDCPKLPDAGSTIR